MSVYLLNLVLIGVYAALAGFITGAGAENHKRWVSRLIAFQLITILALRAPTVGTDVRQYLLHFANVEAGLHGSRFEPAFLLLMRGVHRFTDDPHVFLTVVAVLSIAPVAYCVERFSKSSTLSWVIYICLGFYAFTFSGLRQAIALALTFLSIGLIRRGRWILFTLTVSAAAQFHVSAWAFLPAYWIYKLRIRGIGWLIYVVMAGGVFAFRGEIFALMSFYFFPSYEVVDTGAFAWLLMAAVVVGLAGMRLREIIQRDPSDEGLFNLALAGVTLMIFSSVGTNVMRIADYYYMAVALLLPAAAKSFSVKTRPLVLLVAIPALVLIYWTVMSGSSFDTVPYELAGSSRDA